MKICLAQIKPFKGDINQNIGLHYLWIEEAVNENCDLIVFPELSLTGYEPKLAEGLALNRNDNIFDEFQKICDQKDISIAIGAPIKSLYGVYISMIFFIPNQIHKIYSKQKLHPDEKRYFISGKDQFLLTIQNKKLMPVICYESLDEEYIKAAKNLNSAGYLVSVAKSHSGIQKAVNHFSKVSKRYSLPIFMVNSIGYCDNFISAGNSAFWNIKGEMVECLNSNTEGILIVNTKTNLVSKKIIK